MDVSGKRPYFCAPGAFGPSNGRITIRAVLAAILSVSAALAAGAAAFAAAASSGADAEWLMPSKDYASTRYSSLASISAQNARGLRPVWTFSTGVLGGHEGQPLVVGDTMYVVTPWPNVLYAFDLTREGYPLRWKYRPAVSSNAIGETCCDTINRGAFYIDGKIIYNLLDGHTVAVDAKSGRELWNTQIADVASGETVTMAPLVVRDRVIVGASGGEFGIYGWLKGLDLATGKLMWTVHNLGPDADMGVQAGTFKPVYDSGANLGEASWPADAWRHGGGPVWGSISYDPELDLIYYGTGNAGPYNADDRPGDNKWTSSVLARRPSDGDLVWAYQFTPHDSWDFDATGAMILADLTISGHAVKALVHFDKNGFAYTLDRATGRVLVAQPFAPVNWAKSIDLTTGRPVLDPSKVTGSSRGNVKGICPSLEGGVSPASPGAYSPRTHLFYTSTNNFCMDYLTWHASYVKGTPYMGVNSPYFAGPGDFLGSFIAWDAARGVKVWENKQQFPGWSGALVTGGDVVFYGTLDGWFVAADARNGKVLSKFKVGSGVVGNPITYRGPDGRQYVAVYAGLGGDWALISGDTRSDDPADVRSPAEFIRNIARHTSQGGMVWIFGL
ncbi:MAG TPA: PQQ-dependent dehydrogenase, methanol/ethanol family [Steroidobacteraceae bacterium]|nr:PQQ-dependent dehydrogenase, methanol/ethanol family [Steroidobacteraceae bacterium]